MSDVNSVALAEEAVLLPQISASGSLLNLLGFAPGIALLAVVGYAGKLIEQSIARYGKAHHLVLPNIEYVLWAILNSKEFIFQH